MKFEAIWIGRPRPRCRSGYLQLPWWLGKRGDFTLRYQYWPEHCGDGERPFHRKTEVVVVASWSVNQRRWNDRLPTSSARDTRDRGLQNSTTQVSLWPSIICSSLEQWKWNQPPLSRKEHYVNLVLPGINYWLKARLLEAIPPGQYAAFWLGGRATVIIIVFI